MHRILLAATLSLAVASTAVAQPPGHSNPDLERAREHYMTGWQQMRAESFDRAAAEFQQAIDLQPKYAMAYYGLGRANLALKRYVEAVGALTTCRDLYSAKSSDKFNAQMDVQRSRQDRLLELNDLKSQIGKGPQNAQTQDMMRQVDNAIRQTNDVLSREQNVSIDDPVPSFVSLSLGSALFRSEHFPEAEDAFKAAVAVDSKAGEAHNNLAVIYLMKAQYTEALAEVKAAEKAGFRVNPDLKEEIRAKMGQ
jgi:tetratricopeptide (TPR) repeat protein